MAGKAAWHSFYNWINVPKDAPVDVLAEEYAKYIAAPEVTKQERIQIITETKDLELEAVDDLRVTESPRLEMVNR